MEASRQHPASALAVSQARRVAGHLRLTAEAPIAAPPLPSPVARTGNEWVVTARHVMLQ